jgi:hypothetical protein
MVHHTRRQIGVAAPGCLSANRAERLPAAQTLSPTTNYET